jgi:hypothetical protein
LIGALQQNNSFGKESGFLNNPYLEAKIRNQELKAARLSSVNHHIVALLSASLPADKFEVLKELAKKQVRLRRRSGETYRQFRSAYGRILAKEIDAIFKEKSKPETYQRILDKARDLASQARREQNKSKSGQHKSR